MSRGRSKAPELLADLADHACAILVELTELPAEVASDFGHALAEKMADHWGGQGVYFPQGLTLKLSKRYLQIYEKFNGFNHSELAMEYKVSVQWIYNIVKRVHKEQVAQRQRDIFEDAQALEPQNTNSPKGNEDGYSD